MAKSASNMESNNDGYLITYVAQLMETSEFNLFRTAWRAWYGEDLDEEGIESYFNKYLDYGEVPFWVRNFVRDFLSDETVIEKERERATLGRFVFYAPLVIFLLLFLLVALLRE